MLPTSSHGNAPSMYIANLESASNFLITDTGCRKLANLFNLRFGDLGTSICLAKVRAIDASAFAVHIVRVICGRAKKQVRGIATSRIVAVVADEHSIWYRASRKLISDAACPNGLVVRCSSDTIARIIDIALPRPALIGTAHVNAFPESFGCRHFWFMMANTKWLWLPSDIVVTLVIAPANLGMSATAAFTEMIRKQTGKGLELAPIMTVNITRWLIPFLDSDWLAASTLAKTCYLFWHDCFPFWGQYSPMSGKWQMRGISA